MKDYIKKYKSRIDKNIKNLSNQTIILNGATGGIGSSISEFLSYLHNDLVLLVRNLKEGDKLKKRLEEKYHNKIEIVYFDYLDKNSLIESFNSLKNYAKPTYFLNISGIYHQPYSLMNGIEKTYLVNYLMPSFYIKELLNVFPDIKVIVVSSITSSFEVKTKSEIYSSLNNFINYLNSIKNKTKRYGISKHLLMSYLIKLKKEFNYDIRFTHPGACATNLFDKKNKAYPKLFYYFVPQLLKIIFMPKEKAALSILLTANKESIKDGNWIGPRGLFKAWGYPKEYKYFRNIKDDHLNSLIYTLTEKFNQK